MVLRLLSDLLPAAGMAGAADAALSDQQRGAAGVSARGRGAPPTGGPTPDGLGRPRGATALSRMLPRPIWRGGSCNRPRCCAGTGTWFGAAGATHTGVGVQAWRWRSGLWCCGWLGRTRPGGTAASTVSSAGSATRLGPAPSGLSRHRRRRRRRPRPASQSALGVPLADRLEEKQAKHRMLTLSALHHHRAAAGESTLPLASTSHAQGLPAAQIGLAHRVASASEPPELPEEPPEVVY